MLSGFVSTTLAFNDFTGVPPAYIPLAGFFFAGVLLVVEKILLLPEQYSLSIRRAMEVLVAGGHRSVLPAAARISELHSHRTTVRGERP